jgi:UDP-N-acetylmuramate dehydrogenase
MDARTPTTASIDPGTAQAWDALVTTGPVERDVSLTPLTTYKFGGPAAYFAELTSTGDLATVATQLRLAPMPFLVLGRGSNLVISDEGFPGLVIRLAGSFLDIDVLEDGSILAGGAAPLPKLARTAVKAGRGGLEFFVGIPGSVGGAVQMNAGCHGSDAAAWLLAAAIIDLGDATLRTAGPADLDLAYRHSNLSATDIVTAARFRTEPIDRADGEARLREITAWRKEHQPGGTYNAGSVFKNPEGDAAGRIIDEVGLKGFRRGGVAVSDKHANFFVADPGALAQDVHDLVFAVQARVRAITGITLEPEVRFAGRFADPEERP